jgi:DNA-binding NarL/FixJ family response regulator
MQYEILLVDDEHSIRDTIGPLLEVKEYRVTSVDSGKAAIELVAKRNFDLVITDLVMDEPDGIEVANLVKQGMSTKEIASFFYSSPETISRHRKNIRKKLKLTDKKLNLRTHLLSFHQ